MPRGRVHATHCHVERRPEVSYDRSRLTLDDWLLALHVLSAFAIVGAMVLFWIVIVAMRNVDTPGETIAYAPVANVGSGAIAAGSLGTVVFGVVAGDRARRVRALERLDPRGTRALGDRHRSGGTGREGVHEGPYARLGSSRRRGRRAGPAS